MQVAFNPLDVSIFEASWALAHSYYLLSRTKPTMLQSPRIAQAGQGAMHQAIATALEANVVQIDVGDWAAAIGRGAAAANRADVLTVTVHAVDHVSMTMRDLPKQCMRRMKILFRYCSLPGQSLHHHDFLLHNSQGTALPILVFHSNFRLAMLYLNSDRCSHKLMLSKSIGKVAKQRSKKELRAE